MKNLKNIAAAVASLVVFTNITNSQALKASYSANYEQEPLTVKYLGDEGDYLLFDVTFKPNSKGRNVFAIEDKNEGEIYSSIPGTNFKVQRVKIEKISDEQVLNFKLVSGSKTYVRSFAVNTNLVETTTVAEGDITKL
jgi:hypothetical protein